MIELCLIHPRFEMGLTKSHQILLPTSRSTAVTKRLPYLALIDCSEKSLPVGSGPRRESPRFCAICRRRTSDCSTASLPDADLTLMADPVMVQWNSERCVAERYGPMVLSKACVSALR